MRALISAHFFLLSFFCAAWPQPLVNSEWNLMNGLDAGSVIGVAAGESSILAATELHNVFRSRDSGKSWNHFPVPSYLIPNRGDSRYNWWDDWWENRVYFDPSGKLFYALSDSGVYIAEPTASAWRQIFNGRAVDISADGPTIIIISGQSDGVKVSRDRGRTWLSSEYPTVGHKILSVLAADSCVYASDMHSPVSISCDGGATWNHAGGDSLSHYGYAMVRIPGGLLVASGRGLFRSVDRGNSWTAWTGNLTGENRVVALRQSGGSIFALEGQSYLNPSKLYRTENGGQTWTAVPLPFGNYTTTSLSTFAELDGRYYAATTNGLLASSKSGFDWTALAFGLMRSPILSLGVHQGKHLAYTTDGLFSSEDSGATWKLAIGNDSATRWSAFAGAGSHFAVGSEQGEVRVSTDAGLAWSPPKSVSAGNPVISLAVLGSSVFAASMDGIWRLENPGGDWSPIQLPVPDRPRILAGGRSSLFICGDVGIWEFRADETFVDRRGGLPPLQVRNAWTVEDRLYLGTGEDYPLRWNTSDSTWNRMTGLGSYCFSIAGSGARMIAATSQGFWATEDEGAHWTEMRPRNVRNGSFRTLVFSEGWIYGGDATGGVWKMSPQFPETATGISSPSIRKVLSHRSPPIRMRFFGRDHRVDGRLVRP